METRSRIPILLLATLFSTPLLVFNQGSALAATVDVVAIVSSASGNGYLLAGSQGEIWAYGDAPDLGSPADSSDPLTLVSAALTSSGQGYWLFTSDGDVLTYGDAEEFGSAASISLNQPIIAGVVTVSENGYWLFAADGGVFAYGDAAFYGSAGSLTLNEPVVGANATPGGQGYWMVAADGGVFSYGDARFAGSAGSLPLNQPVIDMASTDSGNGYWLFARDGGVFSYGDTHFFGSGADSGFTYGALAPTPSLDGYWMVTTNGTVVPYGDAQHFGDPASDLSQCSIDMASTYVSRDISSLPVHPSSDKYITSIGSADTLHPDFGTVWDGAPNGIPFVQVDESTPLRSVEFDYDDESDAGPYPLPLNPPIEGGNDGTGDRHILMVDEQDCLLYELYDAWPPTGGSSSWSAGSGAIFDMRTFALRPDGWTSADAAGLPIFPLLVKYDEVSAGKIEHALRFTVSQTQRAYLHPATHFASNSTDPTRPPMGTLLRLRAGFDVSTYSSETQVILVAMKTYGMYLADNGSDWFISGAPDDRWDDDALRDLKLVPGSAFEVVDTGETLRT